MRKFIYVFVLVLAVAVIGWWPQPNSESPKVETVEHAPVDMSAPADQGEVAANRAAKEEMPEGPLGPVEVQGQSELADAIPEFDPSDTGQMTAENLVEFTRRNLELALAGDKAAAYRAARARRPCQWSDIPSLERWDLDEAAEHLAQRAKPDPVAVRAGMRSQSIEMWGNGQLKSLRNRFTDSPLSAGDDFGQARANLQRWHAACPRQKGLFTAGLRKKIEQKAEQGIPSARYLYAVWPLQAEEREGEDGFVVQQRWEKKARKYTWANLVEREWLGLMAYAQSYRKGLFTGDNYPLSLALYKAVVDCGAPVPDLKEWAQATFAEPEEGAEPRYIQLLVMREAERWAAECKR